MRHVPVMSVRSLLLPVPFTYIRRICRASFVDQVARIQCTVITASISTVCDVIEIAFTLIRRYRPRDRRSEIRVEVNRLIERGR
jgi:hypothetical protein